MIYWYNMQLEYKPLLAFMEGEDSPLFKVNVYRLCY